jgi:hypothetical protein
MFFVDSAIYIGGGRLTVADITVGRLALCFGHRHSKPRISIRESSDGRS